MHLGSCMGLQGSEWCYYWLYAPAAQCAHFAIHPAVSALFWVLKHNNENNIHLLIWVWRGQNRRIYGNVGLFIRWMCAREREPHCHRCTSPQLIALCVGVSPLYSTPGKMCVSVHDACKDNRTRSDERVCLHHVFHATLYATFNPQNLWQNYKNIWVQTQIVKQSMRFRGAILFCVTYLAVH